MKKELLARVLILILTIGAGLAAMTVRFWANREVVEVHAAMPDKGGWLNGDLQTRVGETLHLRLVSDDVVHGFALGQSDFQPVDVLPGKPTDVMLAFDEPGTYTFYCTRWCGADHWRMRGTITVTGDEPLDPEPASSPLYLDLGIELDQPREPLDLEWNRKPSAKQGKELNLTLPPEILTQEYYRSHSPVQVRDDLKGNPITTDLSDTEIWDLVALAYQENTDPIRLAEGEALYQRDCAACHGVDGDGNGIFGLAESPGYGGLHETSPDGHSLESPTDFQNQKDMLTASPALLQGKIMRGGMGTGMPSWGLIYTDYQTWALVDFLWSFLFETSIKP